MTNNVSVSVKEMARMLGISINSLNKQRCVSPDQGPPFIKMGRRVLYPVDSYNQWISEKSVGGVIASFSKVKSEKDVEIFTAENILQILFASQPSEYSYQKDTGNSDFAVLNRVRKRPQGDNPKDIAGSVKIPMALVPPGSIALVAQVMKHGADKYGAYNWREKKIGRMAYISAAQRHIASDLDRQTEDDESHLMHLAHAAATLLILMDAIACGSSIDDRPLPGPAPKILTVTP